MAVAIASTCIPRNCGPTARANSGFFLLSVWRESPFYSERERAALAWTEAVTLISNGDMPDEVYDTARAQFSEEELVNLTIAIVAINGANRLNIAFRTVPGSYRAAARQAAE